MIKTIQNIKRSLLEQIWRSVYKSLIFGKYVRQVLVQLRWLLQFYLRLSWNLFKQLLLGWLIQFFLIYFVKLFLQMGHLTIYCHIEPTSRLFKLKPSKVKIKNYFIKSFLCLSDHPSIINNRLLLLLQ